MDLSISPKALHASCFQVLPGTEPEVIEYIKQKYKDIQHVIFKGLGAFDIILIHAADNFEIILPEDIAEKSVLKISQFPCYGYQIKDISNVLETLDKHTFVGIGLLKLDSTKSVKYHDFKEEIISNIRSDDPNTNIFILGTLGWYELVVIIASDSINLIIDQLLKSTNQKNKNCVLKTFSIIALNFNKITARCSGDTISNKSQEALASTSDLSKEIPDNIGLSIAISLKPSNTYYALEYWRERGFTNWHAIGKDDIIVKPRPGITWLELIEFVYLFRKNLSDKILSTNIRLSIGEDAYKVLMPKHSDPIPLCDLSYAHSKYKAFFGKEASLTLTHTLDHLISLCKNPVIGNAFSDITAYVQNINRLVKKKDPGVKNEHFPRQASVIIKQGIDVRLQGTYASIEDQAGPLYLTNGGLQRVFLAAEGLITSVFIERFGFYWEGFAITGVDKFSNINEIINIPIDSAYKPIHWWALYHEIAHVFIDYIKLPIISGDPSTSKLVDYSVPQIKSFLANKSNHDWYINLINELVAEIIGYELGFYNNLDLFMKVVWGYLTDIQKTQKNTDYDQYLIRTFVVEIYSNYIKRDRASDIDNLDILYKLFLKHIYKVEHITGLLFTTKHFIVVNNINNIRELIGYLKYVHTRLGEFTFPTTKELRDNNTRDVFDSINLGTPWLNSIKYPEAVLYQLIVNDVSNFNAAVAFILSLWNVERRIMQRFINEQ